MNDDISTYLHGHKLYGDDFSLEEIQKWFEDEAEGYADLGPKNKDSYSYSYHELNKYHAFNFISKMTFDKALGVGSAYGDEFKPITNVINEITILDPSDAFNDVKKINDTPCQYIKPQPDGSLPFKNSQFNLITSLGVMHHIPNVSYVLGECYRCLSDNGIMLLREPIVSMGDWRKPRHGLTKRERGIPLEIMDGILRDTGFNTIKKSLCMFPVIPRFAKIIGTDAFNNSLLTKADSLLSQMFSRNITYHRTKLHQKFAPASIYYVLQKDIDE